MQATRSAVIRSAALLGVKAAAYLTTGSAVLLAGMVDSIVDLVASLIAHLVKPKSHYEEHQLALIQNAWIFLGGLIVAIETLKHLDEPVEMASVGIAILVLTVVVDYSIVRKLKKETNPVVVGLKEDIMADLTSSAGGIIALTVIALGAPMMVDKVIAIAIAVALMVKGARLFIENMEAAAQDHQADHDATPEVEQEGFANTPVLP
jgi:divalent metal cation (Fe/Co/Zn/Cd) transporter